MTQACTNKPEEIKLTNRSCVTLDSEPMMSPFVCVCMQNLPSGASFVGSLKLTYISKVKHSVISLSTVCCGNGKSCEIHRARCFIKEFTEYTQIICKFSQCF